MKHMNVCIRNTEQRILNSNMHLTEFFKKIFEQNGERQ